MASTNGDEINGLTSPPSRAAAATGVSAPRSAAAARPVADSGAHGPRAFVLDINPNDVACGRGAPYVNFQGNVRFREIIATRQDEYTNAIRRQRKAEIAQEIFDLIASRNGRFLRRIDTQEESDRLGVPDGKSAWAEADLDTAMEKIKQALRHRDPNKAQAQPSPEAEDEDDPTSNGPAPNDVLGQIQAIPQQPYPHGASAVALAAPPPGAMNNMALFNNVNVFAPLSTLPYSPQAPSTFWWQQQQANDQQLAMLTNQRVELERRELLLRQQQWIIQQQQHGIMPQSMMPQFGSNMSPAFNVHGLMAGALNLSQMMALQPAAAPLGPYGGMQGANWAAMQMQIAQQQQAQFQQQLPLTTQAQLANQNIGIMVLQQAYPPNQFAAATQGGQPHPDSQNLGHAFAVAATRSSHGVPPNAASTEAERSPETNVARRPLNENDRPSSSSSSSDDESQTRKSYKRSYRSSSSSSSTSSSSSAAKSKRESKRSKKPRRSTT